MLKPAKQVTDLVEDNSPLALQALDPFDVSITNTNALQVTTVYRCVNAISDALATVPVLVLKGHDNEAVNQRQHPLFFALNYKPNNLMRGFNFRKLIVTSLLLDGNAYILKIRKGRRLHLHFLKPGSVSIRLMPDSTLRYDVSLQNGRQRRSLTDREIIHIRYCSRDGIQGLDPIRLHRQVIETESLGQTSTATSMSDRQMPVGILKMPTQLSPDRKDDIRKEWTVMSKNGKVAVLEQDTEFEALSITQDQAQFLEQKQYNSIEIATKIFGIHPYYIGAHQGAIDLEQVSNQLVDSVLPFAELIGSEIRSGCLEESDWLDYEVVFDLTKLKRYNRQAIDQSIKTRIVHGVISPNEARAEIGHAPRKKGNYTLSPSNSISSDFIEEWSKKQVALGDAKKTSQAKQTGGEENEPEEDRSISKFGPALRYLFQGWAKLEASKLTRIKKRSEQEYFEELAQHHKRMFDVLVSFTSEATLREFLKTYPIECDEPGKKAEEQTQRFLETLQ